MRTRFRLLLIGLGALVIVATYTFDTWYPELQPEDSDERFPGLQESLQEAYLSLPTSERTLYLTMLRDEGAEVALPFLRSAIVGGNPVPVDNQIRPAVDNAIQIVDTEFREIDPQGDEFADFMEEEDASPYRDLWEAEGEISIWQYPDGQKLLWVQDLSVTNGPNLHIGLSTNPAPLNFENMGENYFDLGTLQGNLGSQGYFIGGDVDFSVYNSVVIFDNTFRVIFAVAPY